MKIKELFSDINYKILYGDKNQEILNIENNSLNVKENDDNSNTLFVCIEGLKFDGHNFIEEIIKKGIKNILVSKDITITEKNINIIKVLNTREIINKIAFKLYNNPQNDMQTIGVTGTSGKTSTTIILENILKNLNIKSAVLGTLGYRIGEEKLPINCTTITTPDSLELAKMFNYINTQKINTVIMEATSHALKLHRIDMINFKVGIFTNLDIEHLDFHKTMEDYADAKFKLFLLSKNAVINIDDKYGKEFFKKITTINKLSISLKDEKADLHAFNIKVNSNGTFFDLKYKNKIYNDIFINLVGIFSVYNTISAIAAISLLNIDIEKIILSLKNIDYIKGRCESINNDKNINIIIDYAHTAEQFNNILKALRVLTKNKLITLFGCGGERDQIKRPIMGEVAGKLSDFVIISEDNPRSENSKDINNQIETGLKKTKTKYKIFIDRKEAIDYALSIAKEGDTFVMLGKGPETYQEYENKRREFFSERNIVEEYLKRTSNFI